MFTILKISMEQRIPRTMEADEMYTKAQLIRNLQSFDIKVVRQAIETLRARGWLDDGTLSGLCLHHVHFQGADLYQSDLSSVDLMKADLRWTNLSNANLENAQLGNVNFYQADMSKTNIRGANLSKANLQGVINLTENQLKQAHRLQDAIMPDGSRYDGRFSLPGDLKTAQVRGIDIENPQENAEFYGIFMPESPDHKDTGFSPHTDIQVIRKLRSADNLLVLRAIEELRKRGRLSNGALAWNEFQFVRFQGADLSSANFHKANLNFADLRSANLTLAVLDGTSLRKANLSGANFDQADLSTACLEEANLQGAFHLTEDQLLEANRLRGATLPDGSRYDGRYNLPGDLENARFKKVDVHSPDELAEFYGVSIDTYLDGQLKGSHESEKTAVYPQPAPKNAFLTRQLEI
jgi:uncharacterized protein YjbI with pentapeptide repeats